MDNITDQQLQQPGSKEATTGGLDPARKRCCLMESPDNEDDDPAYFTLFSSEDVIHCILPRMLERCYLLQQEQGGNAAATSFTNLWQSVHKVAFHVGMTQANLVDQRRAFHGVRQHTAVRQTAGKLYKVLPTGAASATTVQKVGPLK